VRVGIIGAGISGLAAARALKASGHQAVIFEKNDRLGGRVATRRIGEYLFDTGASAISPRGQAIEKVLLEELDTANLVKIEKPFYLHHSMRPVIPDNVRSQPARYTYTTGNGTLADLLAIDLDVRLNVQVETLEKNGKGYMLGGEEFDAAILTPPVPQTATILWSLGESRAFANSRFRACLSILLGFAKELPDTQYSALLDPEQRHPLVWLSLESIKSPGRAPAGHSTLVIQMAPSYSLTNFSASDERIIDDALDYLAWLYGDEWRQPEVSAVKRWKYSQPDSVALFETVNEPNTRLVISGDGVTAGRVENAYDSGLRAAALLTRQTAVEAAG
jgi:renalase